VTLARRSYTAAEELSLTTQVGGFCPLCDANLFSRKRSRDYKAFELAHIYPLNPTPEEVEVLRDVDQLHTQPNDPDNIIPLCTVCHTNYDKPRTREEYDKLAAIKRRAIERARQRALIREYPLEDDIDRIISRLGEVTFDEDSQSELSLDPKSVDAKFDDTMPRPTRRKIKHWIVDYYQYIRQEFRMLEQQSPDSSQLIYSQVKTFYLKQKTLGLSQSEIFHNVVQWFRRSTSPETIEAPEIVAAFFIQNCEVFE
jgi:hypothetical protein